MKLLAKSQGKLDLEQLIMSEIQGDYIYMYPPRQAYQPMAQAHLRELVGSSLSETRDQPMNLYIHFPFCRQICGFCNLYSVAVRPDEAFAGYVSLLGRDMRRWAALTGGRTVDTIYLGGGTPSILPVAELDRCLQLIEHAFRTSRERVPEIAIEVAPDTVDEVKLRDMREIGITRINLGLQTTSDQGLHQIGRRHGFSLARKRIEDALGSGFKNVCIDLIYGLPEQSRESWQATVRDVLSFEAPTVCAYPLTLRPRTGFARRDIDLVGSDQYQKYDDARVLFEQAGYIQETHVRYIVPGVGGYRQKVNHWAGQDIIGIGAGARGYLQGCDYRNGYSIMHRRSALRDYEARISQDCLTFTGGIHLGGDERMRRQVILGLLSLDRVRFRDEFGIDVVDYFADQFSELDRLGLVSLSDEQLRLNDRGRKFRDLIVQMFFSEDVWRRIAEFDYAE